MLGAIVAKHTGARNEDADDLGTDRLTRSRMARMRDSNLSTRDKRRSRIAMTTPIMSTRETSMPERRARSTICVVYFHVTIVH